MNPIGPLIKNNNKLNVENERLKSENERLKIELDRIKMQDNVIFGKTRYEEGELYHCC